MGIHRGPNIVKDNLVFGYDTGYGVTDNDTATRFYPGRNTVNYLSDGISNYNIVQGTNWNGATPSYTLGTSEFGTPIGTYNTSGTSYMYSHDYVLDDDLSTLSAQTVTFSVYLKRQGASATVGIRIYDNISGYTTVYAAATNTFQRFTMSKTLGTNPTRIFVMIDNTNGGIIDFHSPQLEIGAASPFVDGTRSSTQSLIDLKRTTDIDVSNVSFDSTGQPSFDETDDHITGVLPMDGLGAPHTIEMVFSSNVNQGSIGGRKDPFSIGNSSTHQYSALDVNTGNMNWYFYSRDTTFTNSPLMVANKFYHIVLSYAGGASNNTNKKVWFNGVQQTLSAGSSETPLLPNNPSFSVGRDRGRNTAYWPGEIPVWKVYQTAFTQEQALQNYNAYKNRFNI